MTSNALLFKLFKKDFSRRISFFTLSCILGFFLFPVITGLLLNSSLFLSGEAHSAERMQWMQRLLNRQLGIENPFYTSIYVLFAAFIAMAGFSFLHKPKGSDFYHGLPVKRSTLYHAVFWSGLFIVLVPHTALMLLSALIGALQSGSADPLGTALYTILLRSGYIFFIYALSAFALSLSGKISVGFVAILCSYFYLAFLYLVQTGYRHLFYDTYVESGAGIWKTFSRISPYVAVSFVSKESSLFRFLLSMILGIFFLAAGLYFYKNRKNEAAGKTIAYPLLKTPIKFLICLFSAMFGGFFFYSMTYSIAWGIFGLLSALIIVHCSMEIFYHEDFKKIFANLHHLLIGALLTVGLFIFYAFDLGGYDRWFPTEASLDSVAITGRVLEENAHRLDTEKLFEEAAERGYMEYYSYYEGEEILLGSIRIDNYALVKSIVEGYQWTASQKEFDGYQEGDTEIKVRYRLKNGKTTDRRYRVNFAIAYPFMEELYNSREYKESIYPLLGADGKDLQMINYIGLDPQSISRLDSANLEKVLMAYKADLTELTYTERFETRPIGNIRFLGQKSYDFLNGFTRDNAGEMSSPEYALDMAGYYPIYASFTRTLNALVEEGIDPYRILDVDDIAGMTLWTQNQGKYPSALREEKDHTEKNHSITDREEQETFLRIAHPIGLPYETTFDYVGKDIYISYHLTVELKDGTILSLEVPGYRIGNDLLEKYNIPY